MLKYVERPCIEKIKPSHWESNPGFSQSGNSAIHGAIGDLVSDIEFCQQCFCNIQYLYVYDKSLKSIIIIIIQSFWYNLDVN